VVIFSRYALARVFVSLRLLLNTVIASCGASAWNCSVLTSAVVNMTALVTLDKADLDTETGHLPPAFTSDVDRGLRRVLGL
jgi:mRNA-degrading endonuclease toxin of MazEF toxin-antitoxin module